MKRFLAILLVLVMVIGVFASCGSSTDTGIEGSDSGEASDEATPPVNQPTDDENNDEGTTDDGGSSDDGTTDDGTTDDGTTDDGKTEEEEKTEDEGGKEEETPAECAHTGGTATCQAAAVCTTCNQPYGEKNASNHTGSEEWTKTDTTHKKAYTCCGAVTVAETSHTGGTATCEEAKVCSDCGASYGSIDPNAHGALVDTWVKKNESTHAKYYECGHEAETGAHTPKTGANCQGPAQCAVCGEYYGSANQNAHVGEKGDWTYVSEDEHVKKYGCGHEAESGAHYGGTANCDDKAICDGCHQEYGSKDLTNHKPSSDEDKVWIKTSTGHKEVCAHCNVVIDTTEKAHTMDAGECTVCGYNPETAAACSHTGGTANCQMGAICTNCGTEYSEVNPNNHAGTPGDWEYLDETYHVQKYSCCPEVEAASGTHEGGTATCQSKAICDGCKHEYNDKDENKHIGTPGGWTYVDDDTCAKYYECGHIAESGEHDGTATCQDKAVCSKCGNEHGALAPDKHVGTEGEWKNEGSEHVKYYTCCPDVEVEGTRDTHTGGTATCQTLAKCDVCQLEYGKKADHAWETTLSNLGDDHGYKCTTSGCNEVDGKTGHDFTGDGECVCGAKCGHTLGAHETCSVCGVSKGHVYDNGVCSGCKIDVKGTKIGDQIILGSYEGKEIEWTIIDIDENGRVLILANAILGRGSLEAVAGKDNNVNAWFTDFNNSAFTNNPGIVLEAGLLSNAYYDEVAALGLNIKKEASGEDWWWWLNPDDENVKAPTDATKVANRVNSKGELHTTDAKGDTGGIVPAMWISLEGEGHIHTHVGHSCSECGADLGHKYDAYDQCEGCELKIVDEDTIEFGSYPQTQVTGNLATTLSGKVGTPNDPAKDVEWKRYDYNGAEMYYIDITHENEKYRGVVIKTDRADSFASGNGYTAGDTVYWFKFEPISWTIIKAEGNKALVLCDLIIDSQRFDDDSRDYETSEIRAWLLEDFYNTAFAKLQQEVILATDIDLNEDGTIDAQDKVFLLTKTEKDAAKAALGSYAKASTDYAKSQGTLVSTDAGYEGNGQWILRTLGNTVSAICRINPKGEDKTANYAHITTGIVPAMWIQL